MFIDRKEKSSTDKNRLIEFFKAVDVFGLAIGGAVYVAAGVPWGFTLAVISAGSLAATYAIENAYKSGKK